MLTKKSSGPTYYKHRTLDINHNASNSYIIDPCQSRQLRPWFIGRLTWSSESLTGSWLNWRWLSQTFPSTLELRLKLSSVHYAKAPLLGTNLFSPQFCPFSLQIDIRVLRFFKVKFLVLINWVGHRFTGTEPLGGEGEPGNEDGGAEEVREGGLRHYHLPGKGDRRPQSWR